MSIDSYWVCCHNLSMCIRSSIRYTHDAWGRLVKVEKVDTATQAVTPISTHRFNGLHWRIAKQWHAVADAQNKPDRTTTFWYDAAWRVVQENQIDQVNEAGDVQESVIQQFWGIRYIDDAVARLRLTGNGSGDVEEGSPEELAFQLTDAQFSVIALATPGEPSVVIDRIAYTPYGESTRTLRSDVNGDGLVNSTDYDLIAERSGVSIGTTRYRVEADLNRDGSIDETDYDLCIADDGLESGGAGGVGEAGLFSAGVRNSVGYCGYIHNEDTGLYTVRFRTYSPTLGRWLTRDPLGYVAGHNLYEYCRSNSLVRNDPYGLADTDCNKPVCTSGFNEWKTKCEAVRRRIEAYRNEIEQRIRDLDRDELNLPVMHPDDCDLPKLSIRGHVRILFTFAALLRTAELYVETWCNSPKPPQAGLALFPVLGPLTLDQRPSQIPCHQS